MDENHVDLTTVTEVVVGDILHYVLPGTFRIGSPVFTMPDKDGTVATHYGGNLQPPSYFFTAVNGRKYVGPYAAVTKIQHDTPFPEKGPGNLEPIGPRIYVQNMRGEQGYITEVKHIAKDDSLWYRVQFFTPGTEPVLKRADSLTVIAESQVERCPNGDDIERSKGLR